MLCIFLTGGCERTLRHLYGYATEKGLKYFITKLYHVYILWETTPVFHDKNNEYHSSDEPSHSA